MRYFEIKDPYYALIKAKDEQECIQIYVENVADDEDGMLQDEIVELDRDTALGKYLKGFSEDIKLDTALKYFDDATSDLLLIDGSLL